LRRKNNFTSPGLKATPDTVSPIGTGSLLGKERDRGEVS